MSDRASSTTATLLFTDVEGSTELRTSRGDALATAILREHEDLVRRCVQEHGGWEVKALGDGFLIAFDSARRAAACAVAIQSALDGTNQANPDRYLLVRMGLHSGEVTRQGDDLYGQAVHGAARIAAAARGGEILASDAVRQLIAVDPELRFRDRGRHRLRGFPERFWLHELVWSKAASTVDAHATPIVRRTPFVGRSTERTELLRHLDRACRGGGGLVFVGGEPGVGKTRLAEELAAEAARRGVHVLVGHNYEMEGSSPFVPFVEVFEAALSNAADPEAFLLDFLAQDAPELARLVPRLRRLFPDLAPPLQLPADQERRYLFDSVLRVLQRMARARPLLLVLDDLQWADPATLLLVEHLAAVLRETPVLVVATYRDVEVGDALSGALGDLHRRRLARRMVLDRLGEEAVAEIVAGLSGREPPPSIVKTIYAETEGNPFFVEEVFQYLAEEGRLFDEEGAFRPEIPISDIDVPEGVRLVVGRRLDRLTSPARQVLTAAAVTTREFTFALLEAFRLVAHDVLLDVIDEAEGAHLVVESGADRFLFSHELIRQTLVAGLSAPRRRHLHLLAADALEHVHAGEVEEHAAEIVHHLEKAGPAVDPRRLGRLLAMAGGRALAASAFEDALRHLEQAEALARDAEPAERAPLLFSLGRALRSLGRWEEALEVWRQALTAYEQSADREATGRACLELSWALGTAFRFEESAEMTGRGLLNVGEATTAPRSRLLAESGALAGWACLYGPSRALLDQGRSLAEELGDREALGHALTQEAIQGYAFMNYAEVVEAGSAAAGILRSTGELWRLAELLAFVELALGALGRFEEADRVAAEVEPLAERLGNHLALMLHVRALGTRAAARSVEEWQSLAYRDLEINDSGLPFAGHSHAWLGVGEYFAGRWNDALARFRTAMTIESVGALGGLEAGYLFRHLAYLGNRDEALALYAERRDRLPLVGQPNPWGSWHMAFSMVEGLVLLGEYDEAAQLHAPIADALEAGVVCSIYDARLLQRLAGIAAGAAGKWDAAEEHFDSALARCRQLPHLRERAETLRFHARMLLDRRAPGDRARARELLAEASDDYRQLGMPRHEGMVRDLGPA